MSEHHLSRFPNYSDAVELDEAPVDLAPADFRAEYVEQHRPCVMRGAAADWPAVQEWSHEVLLDRVGSIEIGSANAGVIYEPVVEYGIERLTTPPNAMPFREFLDEIAEHPERRIQLYAELASTLEPLRADIGTLAVGEAAAEPPRAYSDRFFISARGYTDWHVHYSDETLTTQICGSKEFLLLPPDAGTFRAIFPMSRRGVWKTPEESWPAGFAALRPHRVVLAPGDVVYIPMNWWHAAEASGDELNVTYAQVFATPTRWMADLRLPNVRFSMVSATAVTLANSVAARRPRSVRSLARILGSTATSFRSARRINGPRPADPERWSEPADRGSS